MSVHPRIGTCVVLGKLMDFECMCGAKCSVARDTDGVPCILHPMPACYFFNQNDDPATYLRKVRLGEPW